MNSPLFQMRVSELVSYLILQFSILEESELVLPLQGVSIDVVEIHLKAKAKVMYYCQFIL